MPDMTGAVCKYPIQRTLLVGGVIEKGLASLAAGGKKMMTRGLSAVQYSVREESQHTRA